MSETNKSEIRFYYDGECPLCNSAAHALRIKKYFEPMHLINAREISDDPLLKEINDRGLDLDEGMVIYNDGQFYHGKDALKFMAKYSRPINMVSFFCKGLFWSNIASKITYPWMRGVRNWLLKRKHIGRIDNLALSKEPTFKSVFGKHWDELPPVMKKHYSCRPYTNDVTIVEGRLNVLCKPPLLWFGLIMKLLRQIPVQNQKNVSTTVTFASDLHSKSFHFNRIFHFSDSKPYSFQSRMLQIKDSEVIEIMRFGLCWKMLYAWDGEKITLTHNGYALSFFGHFIPIPLTLLMGKGYAEEIAVDDNTFDMMTNITHPWWGKIYEYRGRFKII